MASVSVKTAVMVKPGDLRSWRSANRMSCSRVVMVGLRVTVGLYGRAIRQPKCLKRNFMRTKRLMESRRRMGAELGVRFRRRVSVIKQGRGQPRLPFSVKANRPMRVSNLESARIFGVLEGSSPIRQLDV